MKLLIINLHYVPDLAPTGQLMTELAEDLACAGIEVTVITGLPGYTKDATRLEVPREERRNGVRVLRVSGFRFHRRSMAGRLMNYFSFYALALLRALTIERQDVTLVLSSPPFLALVGVALQAARGTRVVYNVQDLIPDAIVTTGLLRHPRLIQVAERLSRFLLVRADAVIAVGERMRQAIIEKGIDGAKVSAVHNWADGREIEPLPRLENPHRSDSPETMIVLYTGNMGTNHDFDTVTAGIAALESREGIRFTFVGDGVCTAALQAKVEAEGWPHVSFLPYVPRPELPRMLAAGDVHLVSLKAGLGGKVVPSKVYTSMASGRPVLLVAPADSEVSAVVEEADCGIVVRNGDARGFAAAVARLSRDEAERRRLGDNGRRAFLARYERKHAVRRYREVLERLCPPAPGPPLSGPEGAPPEKLPAGAGRSQAT